MKLALSWLNDYFEAILDWECVLNQLIMAGIEVENSNYLGLEDKIVEFKITPNRGDCLSVLGIAREIAALTNYSLKEPKFAPVKPILNDTMDIIVANPLACPNYVSLIIKEVNNQASLPDYLLKRLISSGLKSVSPIVDITNYVMLELGQPLHAFDLMEVGKQLQVRLARNGETLKLLDGKIVNLSSNSLIISNGANQPAAIAGVMGGINSGIKATTSDIVLESAFFSPHAISGQAKYYALNSDSAYRFERGVDPQLQQKAINYAAYLINQFCGGKVSQVKVVNNLVQKPKVIEVEYRAINQLIGCNLKPQVINDILTKLKFEVKQQNAIGLTLEVPSFRFDINLAQDIAEEIARVYGYDNIQPLLPLTLARLDQVDDIYTKTNKLKNKLVSYGYNEVINYAFIEDKWEANLGNSTIQAIKLQNPIANLAIMRTSLIAGLVKSLLHNLNHGHKVIKLFEVGRVFYGEAEKEQPVKIAGLIYGNYFNSSWANLVKSSDFYDLKHEVELLLTGIKEISWLPCTNYSLLHNGRAAKIYAKDQELGIIGQLHPRLGQHFGLIELPYLFELDLVTVLNQQPFKIKASSINRLPKVERDLAWLIKQEINVGLIIEAIQTASIPYLLTAKVFDIYQGTNVEVGYKSVAINFLFQAHKTLTEEDIATSLLTITHLINNKFAAKLR